MAWSEIKNELANLFEALFGFSINFTQFLQANPTNQEI
jgi:hypothetical protein